MSTEFASEHVCYVHCSLCNSILVVNVPRSNLFNIVTVRCGLCSTLLSVNLGVLLQTLPIQDHEDRRLEGYGLGCGPSSKRCKISMDDDPPRHPALLPPEKRQRAPSAYNRFIKEEIQRIKASNPDITHREAFSAAAKNWAHFPRIHLDNGDQLKIQEAMQGVQK